MCLTCHTQYLSSLNYVLPAEYTSTLSVLQDKAPSRPLRVVDAVLKEEFDGKGFADLFASFDPVPVAAASLAQVHRGRCGVMIKINDFFFSPNATTITLAVTHDGHELAIKVQYPDVSKLFKTDLTALRMVSDLASFVFGSAFAFGWLIDEFRTNALQELDFVNEGQNGVLLAERLEQPTVTRR